MNTRSHRRVLFHDFGGLGVHKVSRDMRHFFRIPRIVRGAVVSKLQGGLKVKQDQPRACHDCGVHAHWRRTTHETFFENHLADADGVQAEPSGAGHERTYERLCTRIGCIAITASKRPPP